MGDFADELAALEHRMLRSLMAPRRLWQCSEEDGRCYLETVDDLGEVMITHAEGDCDQKETFQYLAALLNAAPVLLDELRRLRQPDYSGAKVRPYRNDD